MSDLFHRLTAALAGRYTIERELGAGGMATVYLAQDLKHERQVALKVLRPDLAAAIGPDRFLREITTTANLRHPHILPLYDSGEAGGFLFYVMPYVEGESLRDRLNREKQLPLDDALRTAREVADALSYAHQRGVIHRDIKPENILLEAGHAVVADFGIAKAVSAAGGDRLTETGLAIGTPLYMSPEQASGEQELDGRSDLYALGCVLYEMLAGQAPFIGPTAESLIHQHLAAEPRPITQIRPAVPAELAGVVQRALAKNPADRFNPVERFSEALQPRAVASQPLPTPSPSAAGRWIPTLSVGIAVAAVIGVGAFAVLSRGDRAADADLTSVAVLPFVDMSPTGDMEYFGDGMAEEIMNVLAKVPGLRVAGRTSSFSFKNKNADLKSIGEALEVGTVLEGSVRRSAERVRITAQLVRTDDQSHLWSQTFDRGFDEDVFAVQEEIARAIVSALQVELGGRQAPTVATQRGTESLDAYNAYLLGRFQWNRRTREGVLGSIKSFEEAIRHDPEYARAYTGIADAHSIAGNFGWMKAHGAFPRAREAADRALALAPDLAEAHTSLAAILSWYEWDFEAAEREFQRAIELDPENAFAHYWYAILLDYINRRGDARAELDVALSLDPLALQIRNGLGNHYQWHGEFEAAIREYSGILGIDPDFQNARRWLGLAYIEAGQPAKGLAALDSVPRGFTGDETAIRGWAYAQLGRVEEARATLNSQRNPSSVDVTYIARAYARIGQLDDAFRVLRAAFEERSYSLIQIAIAPMSDPIRSDPRFNELLEDIGLLRYWQ